MYIPSSVQWDSITILKAGVDYKNIISHPLSVVELWFGSGQMLLRRYIEADHTLKHVIVFDAGYFIL